MPNNSFFFHFHFIAHHMVIIYVYNCNFLPHHLCLTRFFLSFSSNCLSFIYKFTTIFIYFHFNYFYIFSPVSLRFAAGHLLVYRRYWFCFAFKFRFAGKFLFCVYQRVGVYSSLICWQQRYSCFSYINRCFMKRRLEKFKYLCEY